MTCSCIMLCGADGIFLISMLEQEGEILAGTPAAEGVSEADMQKREM